ncbi:MAG: DmsC/YnfH family molybdoenzyme membrane anchor subunit [Janthinobacterium lividum]
MALPLHERAMETGNEELVRMTLLEGGASPSLIEALIPSRPLEAGEQYRFHFDMTKCIGCRSCEVACNEQNGNPADIKWRRVGELEGGVYPDTQRTYLSMGCNHCLSADCLRGCPVDAYKKDPVTGIVMHSADACIGCQYCVWNCPYSVPQFNPERGVVGKCDMCQGRLAEGLEPACVNACPENAIQIEIVNKIEWRENYAAADSPGMPPAGHTISTTRITLPENASAWLERVDNGKIALEHAHPSLVVMTTTMQATFGTLVALFVGKALDTVSLTLLLCITALALNVSVFHLGRPAYAWRALKMWRRSWLSREVLIFSLFFVAIGTCTLLSWAATLGFTAAGRGVLPAAIAAIVFGLLGTLASAYIYLVKARPAWDMVHTPIDFLLSAALIGTAMAAAMQEPAAVLVALCQRFGLQLQHMPLLSDARPAAAIALCWVTNQVVRTARLRAASVFEAHASYDLLRGESLSWVVALSMLTALATPLFLHAPLPALALLTATAAVMLGRYLFFVSVVPLSMGLTFIRSKPAHGVAA